MFPHRHYLTTVSQHITRAFMPSSVTLIMLVYGRSAWAYFSRPSPTKRGHFHRNDILSRAPIMTRICFHSAALTVSTTEVKRPVQQGSVRTCTETRYIRNVLYSDYDFDLGSGFAGRVTLALARRCCTSSQWIFNVDTAVPWPAAGVLK